VVKLVRPADEPAALDDAFWLSVCGTPDPSTREKFLRLTIHEFARLGPARFSHARIARRLGVTVAMVNHYFASRAGLIAEATFTVYSDYVAAMGDAVARAERTPEARLRAWIETQIEYAVSVPGWSLVLNYPQVALENAVEFESDFRSRMTAFFNLNISRLAQLILDVQRGEVFAEDLTLENVDVSKYLADRELVALGTSISMATLGAAVWATGSHAPSAESAEAKAMGDFALASHVDRLIWLARTQGK
jgi:AcrR family transcriptional regulator